MKENRWIAYGDRAVCPLCGDDRGSRDRPPRRCGLCRAELAPPGGETMVRYTFTVEETIKVYVPRGERMDERAMEELRRKTRRLIFWDEVAEMETEKAEGAA